MTQVEKIISTARQYVGIKESPANSNNVIFNTEYYGRAVSGASYPWCCVFMWYIFTQAGIPELFYGGGKTASCGTAMNWAKRNGLWVRAPYKAGDLVIFDFGGDGVQDHIGIAVADQHGTTVQTIEGNTGSGSDANGGAVMERTRDTKIIMGAYRPAYKDETEKENDNMEKRYNTPEEIPMYAQPLIKRLMNKPAKDGNGYVINGKDSDKPALDLSDDMLRMLVFLDRAGAFDR
jgi:hypothetical protein